ncbi:MAG: sensor domain-containing diguanylate cyclase [Lachnospiraceae bacterium]
MRNSQKQSEHKLLKIVIIILLVVFLIAGVADYYRKMSLRTRLDYALRLEETGQQIADGIYRHMDSSLSFVEAMAEVFSTYEDIHSPEALACLTKVSEKSDFKRMWLTKSNGKALSSEGIPSNAQGREYYKKALKGGKGISEVQYSKVNGERNVVVYAPIYHEGVITGMVIGIYALDELSDIIDIECFDGKGYSHIVRENGEIITLSKHANAISPGSNNVDYWKEYGYSCPVGINDWYVFITLPEETIVDDLKFNVVTTASLCSSFLFVLCIVLVEWYRVKNRGLRRLAHIDAMTSLLNRGTIETTVNKILLESKGEQGTLLLFDLDHFKNINDTMGHLAGDTLLITVANLMKSSFEEADVLGRLGGDEFVVYMSEHVDRKQVIHKTKEFMHQVEQMAEELDWQESISVSIGLAMAPKDGTDFAALYQQADKRMYQAKKVTGNSYCDALPEEDA